MSTLTCLNIFEKYPIDFIINLTENDPSIILETVKNFKDPNYKSSTVSLFEGREINFITEFFSRYGESIRYISFNYIIELKKLKIFIVSFLLYN